MARTKPGYGAFFFRIDSPKDKAQEDIIAEALKLFDDFDTLVAKYGGVRINSDEFMAANSYADEHGDTTSTIWEDKTTIINDEE